MISNQKEQVEILRILLEGGFIKIEDVVSWADSIIAREANPDIEIIEIALSSKSTFTDFLTRIRNVKGEFNQEIVVRKALKEVYELLERKPELGSKVAGWLYHLMTKGKIIQNEFGDEPYALDDAFELAQKKIWGTEEEALRRVKDYLLLQIKKLND
jgi:hypothetical protein